MILRELLAIFGIKFDDKGSKKADKSIQNLTGKLNKLGERAAVGFSAIQRMLAPLIAAYGFRRLVEMGSDANETLNVLNEVFKANSQNVQDWAKAFGRDVGRSQYELRELAGTIGAILSPMMDNNAAAAAWMSKNLAQLAVDLGSFYNAADTDVLIALRAGLVGETEPMRRFGVNMQVAELEAYALEKGIKKSYKTMSTADKTALRYRFMMEKTRQAQGDAKRTADGFANAIKGVQGAFKDMAIDIMSKAMPYISKFTAKLRDYLPIAQKIIEKSNIISSALIILGTRMLMVWLPTLIPMALTAAAIGALILVVDELITTFTGGESLIGTAIDSMFGKGTTQQLVNDTKNGIKILKEEAEKMFNSVSESSGTVGGVLKVFFDDWTMAMKDDVIPAIKDLISWVKDFTGASDEMINKIGEIIASMLELVPGLGPIIKAYRAMKEILPEMPTEEARKEVKERKRTAERGVGAPLLKGSTFGRANADTVEAYRERKKAREKLEEEKKAGTAKSAMVTNPSVTNATSTTINNTRQTMRGPITTNNTRRSSNVNNNLNVTNNINAPANASPQKIARETIKETQRVVDKLTRSVLEAHRQGV